MHVSDRRISDVCVAHLVAIYAPAHVFGCPLECVSVPLVLRVEAIRILVRLSLFFSISINHVG